MTVGLNLPQGATASSLFQALLAEAAAGHPGLEEVLVGATKENLPERLVEFEALRASDLEGQGRVDVAQALTQLSSQRLVFVREDGVEVPFADYMEETRADPLPMVRRGFDRSVGLMPQISYQGRQFIQGQIADLARDFLHRHTITRAASEALGWVSPQRVIPLRGKKFVVMGAGAELAPTRLLLEAGATVLFLDKSPAEKFIADRGIEHGTIDHVPGGVDLLAQPAEIAATIDAFSGGEPVHIGAFAYFGGNAMEWRLTAAMNGIIRRLDPSLVGSIGLYVSPTAPAEAQPEDAVISLAGYENPSWSDRLWRRLGVLKANLHRQGDTFWPHSIVPRQGMSYLAAQYIEKRLAAEVFATRGTRSGERRPVTVSANVAGVSQTRSMQLPIFQAGFVGAPYLGLETYQPATTVGLSGLLYLEGILDPLAVGSNRNPFEDENEKARRLSTVQVHGAIFAYPYASEGAMTRAAVIGMRKKPGLIPRVLRGK